MLPVSSHIFNIHILGVTWPNMFGLIFAKRKKIRPWFQSQNSLEFYEDSEYIYFFRDFWKKNQKSLKSDTYFSDTYKMVKMNKYHFGPQKFGFYGKFSSRIRKKMSINIECPRHNKSRQLYMDYICDFLQLASLYKNLIK